MDIKEFVTQFGVSAEVTHLKDFVTHTQPDENGQIMELIERQWVIIYEHPDVVHGDQRILVIPHTTGVDVGPSDLDPVNALRDVVSRATEGALTFEEYIGAYFHIRRETPNEITVEKWAHPLHLYGSWHEQATLYHQLHRWCSSPAMREALDMIDVDY